LAGAAARGAWSAARAGPPDDVSAVCAEDARPPPVARALGGGWRALAVQGPLPFTLTGVVSGLTAPLAQAGIPVFVLSTYDTDYLLVRSADSVSAFGMLAGAVGVPGRTTRPRAPGTRPADPPSDE